MSAATIETIRIQTSDGLHVACDVLGRSGSRCPVIFLHGGGQTRHSWGSTASQVAVNGHPCWSVDLRGHGESDWAADGDYSTEAMVEDLGAILTQIGRPPVLVGASMGGLVGLMSEGKLRPGGLWGLVLVDVAKGEAQHATAHLDVAGPVDDDVVAVSLGE